MAPPAEPTEITDADMWAYVTAEEFLTSAANLVANTLNDPLFVALFVVCCVLTVFGHWVSLHRDWQKMRSRVAAGTCTHEDLARVLGRYEPPMWRVEERLRNLRFRFRLRDPQPHSRAVRAEGLTFEEKSDLLLAAQSVEVNNPRAYPAYWNRNTIAAFLLTFDDLDFLFDCLDAGIGDLELRNHTNGTAPLDAETVAMLAALRCPEPVDPHR